MALDLEALLPSVCAWVEEQERYILSAGRSLTATETADAAIVGVRHPERVRVLLVDTVPMPEEPALRAAAAEAGLLSPSTTGMAMHYGIFIRRDFADDRLHLAHELAHTAQYERFGGIAPFLRQYLSECLAFGYPASPLEREANLAPDRLRDLPSG